MLSPEAQRFSVYGPDLPADIKPEHFRTPAEQAALDAKAEQGKRDYYTWTQDEEERRWRERQPLEAREYDRRARLQDQLITGRETARQGKPEADDPNLPEGVRTYLDTFATKYAGRPADALKELEREWQGLKKAHAKLDPGKARKYVLDILGPLPPEGPADALMNYITRQGGAPAPPAAPAPAPKPVTPVASKPPPPVAPPPAAPSADPRLVELQQQMQDAMRRGDRATVSRLRSEYVRLLGRTPGPL